MLFVSQTYNDRNYILLAEIKATAISSMPTNTKIYGIFTHRKTRGPALFIIVENET